MISFHGSQEIKDKYVARLKEHRRLDQIVHGTGYDGSRTLAAGRTLDSYNHASYEKELGLPEWVAHLEDRIFEGIPIEDAPQFALDFLVAIPVGVCIEKVKWQLAIWRHNNQIKALEYNQEDYVIQCKEAIKQVINYCESMLSIGFNSESAAWSAAEFAAWSVRSAVRSAAYMSEAAMLIHLLKQCK